MRRIFTLVLVLGLGSACAGTEETTEPRDPDILVSVSSTGVHGYSGTRVPDFEMWADGTVFLNGDGPFGIDRYRLSDQGVDEVRDLVAGISTNDGTYGEVTWTDQGTTTIYLNLDGEPADVSIYALKTITDPEDMDELRRGQIEARLELLDILSTLDGLGERTDLVAEAPAPDTPDEIELTLLPAPGGASDEEEMAPIDWPLDVALVERPLSLTTGRLCTLVRGVDAAKVAKLVEQRGVQPRQWSTGVASGSELPDMVQVVVHGLLPGHEGFCPEQSSDIVRRLSIDPFHPVELVDPSGWDGMLAADRFEQASPLEMYVAAPVLATAAIERAEDPGAQKIPSHADLTRYEYRVIAAELDGTRYLDVEAQRPELDDYNPRGIAESWRARIDLAAERLTTLEIDD